MIALAYPCPLFPQAYPENIRPGSRVARISRRIAWSGAAAWLFMGASFAQVPEAVTTQSGHTEPVATQSEQRPATDTRIESILVQLRIQRLVLAIQQLGLATRTHNPFLRELELVRRLGDGESTRLRPDLEALAKSAETGVATVGELRDSFGVILLPKLQALQASSGPWTDRARLWLSQIIAPTPSNQATDQETVAQKLVISAVDRLAEDDLRGAVELIGQLSGTPAALTVRWLNEARARLNVDLAHEALSGVVVDLLSQTP